MANCCQIYCNFYRICLWLQTLNQYWIKNDFLSVAWRTMTSVYLYVWRCWPCSIFPIEWYLVIDVNCVTLPIKRRNWVNDVKAQAVEQHVVNTGVFFINERLGMDYTSTIDGPSVSKNNADLTVIKSDT